VGQSLLAKQISAIAIEPKSRRRRRNSKSTGTLAESKFKHVPLTGER